jgi:histidinol dehydrogenase
LLPAFGICCNPFTVNILSFRDQDFSKKLAALAQASSLLDPQIEKAVRMIVKEVERDGDAALVRFTKTFDKVELTAKQMRLSDEEWKSASQQVAADLKAAVRLAHRNIQKFSRQSLRKDWKTKNAQGGWVGEKFDPLERVGIYVPGGTAPLISTVLMTVTLAKVAGCKEIVVCTPPGPGGKINATLLYALRMAGATEAYKIGGSQAIAAMALGTKSIRSVVKIFGPGNAYVVAAKRQLFGRVAVDLLPGPSEVLILADKSANAAWIAADLIAQAEQGSGRERVWLVTSCKTHLISVPQALERQLGALSRCDHIRQVLAKEGWILHVKSRRQGVEVINTIAPEHCQLMVQQPEKLLPAISTSGALFVGPYSPTAIGDYVAGPSHVLPTGGSGRSFGGLTVEQFQRRTSVVKYDRQALGKSLSALKRLTAMEGLDGHWQSVQIRNNLSDPEKCALPQQKIIKI